MGDASELVEALFDLGRLTAEERARAAHALGHSGDPRRVGLVEAMAEDFASRA